MAIDFSWLDSLRESLFRNVGVRYRNSIGLLLGSAASILLLSSDSLHIKGVALVFVFTLATTMLLLIIVRPSPERKVDRFAWGLFVVIVLGFGLGALVYQYRAWWKWLWRQYLRINTPEAIILESLFLLGVILGVYVVRNWAKEQKAFQDSLSGALGGTFIAAVLGKVQEGLTPMRALAYYALGFTMSGVLNLLFAARLTANYTNRRSITSRAVLDFLYGSERAEIIDGYFLKKFKADPDFAKARLTDTLREYQKLVKREFANRMEERRQRREKERATFIRSEEAMDATLKSLRNEQQELDDEREKLETGRELEKITEIENRLKEIRKEKEWIQEAISIERKQRKLKHEQECLGTEREEPGADDTRRRAIDNRLKEIDDGLKEIDDKRKAKGLDQLGGPWEKIFEILLRRYQHLQPCASLKADSDELRRLLTVKRAISSSPEQKTKQKSRLKQIDDQIKQLNTRISNSSQQCSPDQSDEWFNLDRLLSRVKPSYFYWLIAIECEEDDTDANTDTRVDPKDRSYKVLCKQIGSEEVLGRLDHCAGGDSQEPPAIHDDMFRVGVAVRWKDVLDYIVAPGRYGASFPYFGSVAGLALMFSQIIIMDRDMHQTFRDNEHIHGLCPKDIEQDRGLDEIDFLSYISIPVINPIGDPAERGLGIVNIDTKLFVTPRKLDGEIVKASERIFRTRLTPRNLTEFACDLYEQDDEDVRYVDELTKIITPVMVLYASCRVGATVSPV